MTISSKRHVESLDGLRGIAILLVFLFHYLPRNPYNPLSNLARIGWSGVDLFFVLSGFLITGILYDTRNSTGYFKTFYARRALRLLPLYCFAIGVVIVGSKFLQGSRNWLDIPYFVYGANVVRLLPHAITQFPPYFDCGHFWSLALEEQFYTVWPLVVYCVTKRRTLMQICVGGIAAALGLRIVVAILGASPWIAYAQLPTRMDSLLAGSLLALALRGPTSAEWLKPARLRWILAASSLMLVAVLATARTFSFLSAPMSTVGYAVLAAISTSLLALALIPGTIASRVGRNGTLRFFGRYSYGLYVWHYLPYPICSAWLGSFRNYIHPVILADMVYLLTLLALFTGCAVLSYKLLEVHFLKLKSRFVATPELTKAAAD